MLLTSELHTYVMIVGMAMISRSGTSPQIYIPTRRVSWTGAIGAHIFLSKKVIRDTLHKATMIYEELCWQLLVNRGHYIQYLLVFFYSNY